MGFPGGPESGSNSRGGSLEVLQILGSLCTPGLYSHLSKNSFFFPCPIESEVG